MEGTLFDTPDWADQPVPQDKPELWQKCPLNEPGTHFKYNDVRVNLLAYYLFQVWRRPLPLVLRESIMDPIRASDTWRWHGYEKSKKERSQLLQIKPFFWHLRVIS